MSVDEQRSGDQLDCLLADLDENSAVEVDSTVRNLHAELATLADQLRRPAPANPHVEKSAFLRAVQRVRDIGRSPSPSTIDFANTDEANADLPESRVIGPYKLLAKLGAGGMGTVYKAIHTRLGKVVALKVLPTERKNLPESVARFEREMKAVGQLDHPHIVRASDAGDVDGKHFLVMEYVAGIDLDVLIKRAGPLPIPDACELVRQAAMGLQAAHAQGMVHRDIKPANLMLTTQKHGSPVVKVLDLGLALLLDESEAADVTGLTGKGHIMGTIDYMAPEQAGDSHAVDIRADVYSLGATLYALLTGGSIFKHRDLKTVMQKLSALATESVPPIRDRRGDVPDELAAIIHRMLARDPEERYATPADVANALKPFAAEAELSALLTVVQEEPAVIGENEGRETQDVAASSSQETVRPTGGVAAPVSTPVAPVRRRPVAFAAAMVGGIILLAGILLSLRTKNGEVVVELGDDVPPAMAKQIKIEVSGNGELKIADAAQGWNIVVNEGDYSVKLAGGIDRFQLDKNHVTVTRGGKTFIRVTLKPKQNAARNASATTGENPKVGKAVAGWYGWATSAPKPAIAPFNVDKAKQSQEAWAKYLGVPVEYTNSIGMKFRLIPPGEFLMGSTHEEIESALKEAGVDRLWQETIRSEGPQHQVILTKPFYLGVTEVTQAQYELVMGANPSHFSATGRGKRNVAAIDAGTYPVEMISWNEAAEFCGKLSRRENLKSSYHRSPQDVTRLNGTGYRLPTEAQWEFACRAGTTTRFWTGERDNDLAHAAWHLPNSRRKNTHPVAGLKANPFGLYDVHGNVSEWVEDGWDKTYYGQFAQRPAVDPVSPGTANSMRIRRGGGWWYAPSRCRSAYRQGTAPFKGRLAEPGIRVALLVDAVKAALRPQSADWKPTAKQQEFFAAVAKLKPDEQVDTVRKKLMEVNPGFDGKVEHKIENGQVSELFFNSDAVSTIWPVRALSNLGYLRCNGRWHQKHQLADLSPLKGMKLTRLDCGNSIVADLSPLEGMPLTVLNCLDTRVSDLSPLRGMPLKGLDIKWTRVGDLSLLKGRTMDGIKCNSGLFDLDQEAILRSMKPRLINVKRAADYWELIAASRRSAETFAAETAKLSADNQVAAVAAKLKQLNIGAVDPIATVIEKGAVTACTLEIRGWTSDVTPLRAFAKLKKLTLTGGQFWLDISAVNSLPLEELTCTADIAVRNAPVLRGMKTLKTINGQPSAQYLDALSTDREASVTGKR